MKKKWMLGLAVVLCLTLGVVLCGCGSSESEEETETYTVSTEPTYPPFDTTNDDGDVVGFDMDLITAIGEDQGFEVEFQTLEFDALIPSLQSDSTDIIIAGMTITDERKEEVDFSDPYYTTGVAILVKADNTSITGWDDFTASTGYRVAAQTGTVPADTAQALKDAGEISEAVTLNQVTTAVEQLKNGDVDAIFVDREVGAELANEQGDDVKLIDKLKEDSVGDFGIAVKKGNSELLEKINTGLANIKEDGTYDELCEKWNIEVK